MENTVFLLVRPV